MRPLRVPPGTLLPGLVGLLLSSPSAAVSAQEGGPSATSITWEVGTPKAGWCIHFLMEPTTAVQDLARGHRLVPAHEATGLPTAVRRVVADEPQYADWTPAELCTYVAEVIFVDGRRFDRGDGGRPIALLYWGVSAATAEGSGPDSGRVSLRVLATNSSGLQRAMQVRQVPIDRVDIDLLPVKESDDQQFLLKLEGATIAFIGHPRQDSTLTVGTRSQTGAYMGNNKALWTVRFNFQPGEVAAMAGALRITGKRGLAKALNRSPIRLLSPILSQGKGTVSFDR
jgi:hypothetical protein